MATAQAEKWEAEGNGVFVGMRNICVTSSSLGEARARELARQIAALPELRCAAQAVLSDLQRTGSVTPGAEEVLRDALAAAS
jgi:hypothetical protein